MSRAFFLTLWRIFSAASGLPVAACAAVLSHNRPSCSCPGDAAGAEPTLALKPGQAGHPRINRIKRPGRTKRTRPKKRLPRPRARKNRKKILRSRKSPRLRPVPQQRPLRLQSRKTMRPRRANRPTGALRRRPLPPLRRKPMGRTPLFPAEQPSPSLPRPRPSPRKWTCSSA